MNFYQDVNESTVFEDLSVKNSVWEVMSKSSEIIIPDSSFESNHWIDGSGYTAGSDISIGDPGFVDSASNDFHPNDTSPLIGRVDPLIVPVDAAGSTNRGRN